MGITSKAHNSENRRAIQLLRQGMSNVTVGVQVGRSCTWVRNLRKTEGIPALPKGNPPSINLTVYAEAQALVRQCVPSAKIAAKLQIPLPIVYYMAYKRNVLLAS